MRYTNNFMERISLTPIILAILTLVACHQASGEEPAEGGIYGGIEFDMPRVVEPEFPEFSVSIVDFGAVGDGQVLNTDAIAGAIAAVAEKGGGRVVIPRGLWLTGPIILESNINLHAEAGALVVFSRNKDHYPLVESSFEGLKTARCMSPITGRDLENIAFTGEGVYDGSGEVWRQVKRFKMTDKQWNELLASGGVVNEKGTEWYPSESFLKGKIVKETKGAWFSDNLEDYEPYKDFMRPVMVSLINCRKVLLDGPVFQNSAAWCIHPLMCEDLTVRNIDVRNPWHSQNGDGIDIESCRNSLVYNCTFDVGDDAICIKSGRDREGRERNMPTENLIVKNCVVYHGHGGFTVGSETSGGVKHMHVSGCTFIGTDVGIRFKSNRGRGGVVEKIYISDIDMVNIPTNAISFNLYYQGMAPTEMIGGKSDEQTEGEIPPVTEETPQFKDIRMSGIRCKGASRAIYLQGLPELNLENVHMEDLVMEAEKGLVCIDAKGITIRDLELKTSHFPAMTFHNARNVNIKGLELPASEQAVISVNGKGSGQISLPGKSSSGMEYSIHFGEEVKADAVQIQ
jgi:polygalacturonase